MRTISAGETVVQLIEQCVDADQPLLIHGPHGIGKSELFKAAANRMGIGFISRDLALMEPSDLIGMPFVGEDGRTRFAPPAFLPSEGRGLFTIEEINRAPRYMIAPCLQLLTERRLNDYVLPPGWIPMAAINPGGADYHVDDLDPAMLARFVQVLVNADVTQWTYWARQDGNIHPSVIEFAEQSPGIFAPGETNPRAWTYLSKQVQAWERTSRTPELLITAASGLVGETWAVAFYQFLSGGDPPLAVEHVVEEYAKYRDKFKRWVAERKLDLVRATLYRIKRFLDVERNYEAVSKNEPRVNRIREFIEDLPADLRKEIREWFAEKNYEALG
jgi:hypothetical protein